MKKESKLALIYYIFVAITFLTLIPPILFYLGYKSYWFIYAALYSILILVYTWYRFILLAMGDFKPKLWGVNLYSPFTVIIPCYNERSDLLEKCVKSVVNAVGEKKIIIIDDGSKNNIWETIQTLASRYPNILTHRFEKNKGKREALYWAFGKIETDYIITIDSDTIIDKHAFAYLIAPFVEKNIGATTGNIRLINEKKNLLTRIIAGLYLTGLDNYKKAQSVKGNVICCSGCLSAYRTKIIKEIADAFLHQTFLGKESRHSEDRHLTNLILEKKMNVVYVEEAMCYTETPDTLVGFLKQQQRWKRGFARESIYLLSFSWKTSKTLFIEASIGNVLPYFLNLGLQVFIISMMFISPMHVLKVLLPGWMILLTVRELPVFLNNPKRAFFFYLYIPLYELILFWQNPWAILTVNDKNWLTRNIK